MSAAEPLPRESYYGFEAGETCDRDGALRIARAIEDFWAAQGKIVNTRIINKGFHPTTRGARFEVQTDMRNGYPNPDAVKLSTTPVEVKWERDQ